MTCPSNEMLVGFAASDLPVKASNEVRAHLEAGCESCERELGSLAELRRLAEPAVLEDPPAWVLRRAESIPGEMRENRLSRYLGTVARLVFDTFRDPLPQGARAGAATGRQMLYRVGEFDVDVRIDAAGASRYRVSGQVLPGPNRPLEDVAGAEVGIVTGGRTVALSATNEIGEFAFDSLGTGEYSLAIDVNEEILLVEGITLQST
jgi:hypothetical protein